MPRIMDGNADMFYVSTVGPNNNINAQYNGRLDYQVTDKDLVAYDIYYVPVNNTSYNGPQRASNIFYHNALNYSTGLLYNHTFSSTLLNEARADMAGWKWNELADNPQSPLGLPNDYHRAEQRCVVLECDQRAQRHSAPASAVSSTSGR